MSFEDVINAIRRERQYQDAKWGTIRENPHTIGEWIVLLDEELKEAKRAWTTWRDESTLREILQVAAVAVACLEQHGVVEREDGQA